MKSSEKNSNPSVTSMPEFIDRSWVSEHKNLISPNDNPLILDFLQTKKIDSAGICFIRILQNQHKNAGKDITLRNIRQEHLSILQSWGTTAPSKVENQPTKSLFVSTGTTIINAWETSLNALSILAEMLYWGTIGIFHKREMRKGSLGEQMYQLGFNALFIVVLLAFLIGLVLALQTSIQLEIYGAGIFLAPLIGVSMVREFGPLMTAIILAGRTGSATTAEIATMGVGEEIDALKTMGINPIQFIVVPKFWAISITMPLLSIMATIAGIFGGYLIAVFYLDLASNLFWNELAKSLQFRDILAGFTKSVVFSWLIIWIGAFYGFRVHGGAEAVGKETTASVVTGIFIIIIADAIFSFMI